MRKTKYVQILRETARDYDGELWSFLPGDELRVEGIDMLEDPPTVPLSIALDLINKRDATALSVRDVGADLELVTGENKSRDDGDQGRYDGEEAA